MLKPVISSCWRLFLQVSDQMASNEYVYIVCQNMKNGRVITIVDNRDQLEADMHNNADPSANLISKFFIKKEQV